MIFKIAKCPKCKHRERDTQGKTLGSCRKCGTKMQWVYPKGGGAAHWYIRVKGVTKSVGPKRDRAVEEAAKVITDYAEGRSTLARVRPITWDQAAKKFVDYVWTYNKPRTAEFYESRMRTLEKFFGKGKPLHNITRSDVDDLVLSLKEQVSKTTINRTITTLRRFLSWAKDRRHVLTNVVSKYPMFDEESRERYYTHEETDRILHHCQDPRAPDHLYPIVVVALDTGLRRFDIFNLKRSELDFKNGFIRKETCVKQRRPHRVDIPMTNRVKTLLGTYMAQQGGICEWVFPSKQKPGQPMHVKSQIGFGTALSRAKIEDGTFHDLRRTFATRWAEQDGDMKTLQLILDHRSIEITAGIYTRVSEARKRQQIGRFENGKTPSVLSHLEHIEQFCNKHPELMEHCESIKEIMRTVES